ncbi:LysE family translocator [Rhodococcus sp. 114MFTsu3.1]|uniref:LysE family translocator n=1 Tax=Rhodococcus sp. 114MFTsu3.1 TaxID=1172184 RepID=UPI000377D73C|nr:MULTISPECIES: LysE family translocator [unclassified Rhodococcus (in: high G+C Gram-positive bacteria)]OZC78392.1 LysE family translocator [Rhodococcus sp. 06-418-1B]
MNTHMLWGFAIAAALAYVIPGPDWFVVLRHSSRSRADGLRAALGVQSGLMVHLTVAALGLSAVLLASAQAFTVVKLLGAAYLVYLGVQSLRDAVRGRPAPDTTDRSGRIWAQAFLANVLNPKAALFFVAVLPQFIDPAAGVTLQIVVLGVLDIALGALWWLLFVVITVHLQGLLRRRRARMAIDGTAGVALCGLGGALAFTSRP